MCILLLNSCTNVKNALTGKKSENSDEFLVEKKNPLEMPPNYKDLPVPSKSKGANTNEDRINEEIEDLLTKIKKPKKKDTQTLEVNGSAEQFILKNIK